MPPPRTIVPTDTDLSGLGLTGVNPTGGWEQAVSVGGARSMDLRHATAQELAVLRREGALVRILDDLHLATPDVENRSARADLVASVTPPEAVVTLEAACWVWGGPVMTRITFTGTRGARAYQPHPSTQLVQNTRIPPEHVRSLPCTQRSPQDDALVRITSPEWTALDLLRRCTESSATTKDALTAAVNDPWLTWLLGTRVDLDQVRDLTKALRRTPGLRTLREILDAPEITS